MLGPPRALVRRSDSPGSISQQGAWPSLDSTSRGCYVCDTTRPPVRTPANPALLVSGSWDATLKVWDPHASPDAALLRTLPLPSKVFAMDCTPSWKGPDIAPVLDATPRLVVAMAERAVYVYNLQTLRDAVGQGPSAPVEPEQTRESSLKFMLRDLRCMPSGIGYATSSVEGRIAVEFFDASPEGQAQKYAFKSHRKEVDGEDVVYPIHAMAFHPWYVYAAHQLWHVRLGRRRRTLCLVGPGGEETDPAVRAALGGECVGMQCRRARPCDCHGRQQPARGRASTAGTCGDPAEGRRGGGESTCVYSPSPKPRNSYAASAASSASWKSRRSVSVPSSPTLTRTRLRLTPTDSVQSISP